ncbi:hypothetical protein GQ53DRAFT_680153 [Thozetella sp. PMI_491]|nr:hypothetical protein GQ53DRAFT_680153 [Thozetella sp. PMI_491]
MAQTADYHVQILDKSDHTKQVLVNLPASSVPPLSKGWIRIQSRILSVTTNNFTYARLGHLLGWWGVWDQAPALPEPYNDASKYGRISSWGYAEVIESMHDSVPVGTKLWGYMPIGDYPEALEVDIDAETGHVVEVSERRRPLFAVYNRYIAFAPDTDLSQDRESRGLDSIMQILFETAYLLNRYSFSWDEKRGHPMGIPAPWSAQDADITGAVVVLLAPSGKTGLAFAHQLRQGRPADKLPKKVVAVGSTKSRDFSVATGLFDDVLLYPDFKSTDLGAKLGIEKGTKVLLVNFAARDNVEFEWYTAFKGLSDNVKALIIGGDPSAEGMSALIPLANDPNSGVVRGNASGERDDAMAIEGRAAYFEKMLRAWNEFKKNGTIPGLKLEWGKGMDSLVQGWASLAAGEGNPMGALVYEI